ncbi:hypothetical protein [Paenibacillus kobensis]|uniref:hypothetical protein n=1 Tax=Paenibacillus kobensis TaxID=59841 RepID=UPI000FD90285|nr:hypothetical protein [Paenibacillus kobensis]
MRQLPLYENPGFETECYHNLRLSILFSSQTTPPWFLSRFTNLTLLSNDSQFPVIRFEDHLSCYTEVLDERGPDHSATSRLLEYIASEIDKGQYILIFLNWKYIEVSQYFGLKNLIHEALVYGYDKSKDELYLAGFDVDGKKYGTFVLKSEELLEAYNQAADEHDRNRWLIPYGYPIASIALQEEKLSCWDFRNLYFAFDKGRNEYAFHSPRTFVLGSNVAAFLAYYFEEIATTVRVDPEEYVLWNINIHKLLIHNRVMIKRCEALHERLNHPLLDKAAALYRKRNIEILNVKLLSYRYQKHNDGSLLSEISNRFQRIYEQEKRGIPLLMEYLTILPAG